MIAAAFVHTHALALLYKKDKLPAASALFSHPPAARLLLQLPQQLLHSQKTQKAANTQAQHLLHVSCYL